MSQKAFTIRVPCSSANLGPGFDVIGLALSLRLTLRVRISPILASHASSSASAPPLNCTLQYTGQGSNTADISLDPEANLITRVALYVLRCHGQRAFPPWTDVEVDNPIPLGRGLGSSAAAVVAGVVLGNEVGGLGLGKERLLDFCLMVERHPDNLAAALFGGFVGTYLNELEPADLARAEIPLAEVLPAPAGGIDTGVAPPVPPEGIGHYMRFPWAPEIRAVAVIPDYQVPTARAREVLPVSYARKDVIYNLQRAALLPAALGQSPPSASMIYLAMQDRLHQPYRQVLVPGLAEILAAMTPAGQPGLLGICLSGAGPTILALATERFEEIAGEIVKRFEGQGIRCSWLLLDLAEEGAVVERK